MTRTSPAHGRRPRPAGGVRRMAREHRLATLAILVATLVTLSTGQAFAQVAFMSYQIAWNGGFFGPRVFVSDNQAGDNDARPFFVTVGPITLTDPSGNSVITLNVQMVGEGFLVPAPGRRLRVTTGALCGEPAEPACPPPSAPPPVPVTASVPLGFFNPLNTPFPSVELIACYDFSGLPVGPPQNFGSRLHGFLSNLGGPANDIDFAQVGWNSDCGCAEGRTRFFDHGSAAGPFASPPVPFDSFINFGLSQTSCSRIGGYLFIKLRNDGDSVQLPGSAEGTTTQMASVPTVSKSGLTVLLVALPGTGTWIVWRRRPPMSSPA